MEWRLRERLRIAVLGLPLALAACSKQPRTPRAVVIDAGVAQVRPQPADAAVAELPVDAAIAPVAVAKVRPPRPERCSSGRWCGPPAQAQTLASASSKIVSGCASSLRVTRHDHRFPLALDARSTERARAAGNDHCCYTWQEICIPTPGRALTDRGVPTSARLAGAWPSDAAARTWIERGLAEHAAIAAFERATDELLAVAAPALLIAAARRARGDEIAHAAGCFAIARAAGASTRLQAMATPATRGFGLPEIAASTFVEACIPETLAVLEADAWLRTAGDAERPLIGRIVRDETRHAELGWQTVAWALAEGGEDARDALADAAREVRARLGGQASYQTVIEPTLALL